MADGADASGERCQGRPGEECERPAVTRCATCGRAICARHGYKTWWWLATGAHYGMICAACQEGEAGEPETRDETTQER
jgi:hypothetical protein